MQTYKSLLPQIQGGNPKLDLELDSFGTTRAKEENTEKKQNTAPDFVFCHL